MSEQPKTMLRLDLILQPDYCLQDVQDSIVSLIEKNLSDCLEVYDAEVLSGFYDPYKILSLATGVIREQADRLGPDAVAEVADFVTRVDQIVNEVRHV